VQRRLTTSLEERFDKYTERRGDCLVWTGLRRGEYGRVSIDGEQRDAHRVAFEIHNGPIPKGLEVRHRCDNPPCVEPTHLLLGTQADNMQDMKERGRSGWRQRDACSAGHEYTEENTYISKKGARVCRTCRRGYQRR
jgi:hypothetical protein